MSHKPHIKSDEVAFSFQRMQNWCTNRQVGFTSILESRESRRYASEKNGDDLGIPFTSLLAIYVWIYTAVEYALIFTAVGTKNSWTNGAHSEDQNIRQKLHDCEQSVPKAFQ